MDYREAARQFVSQTREDAAVRQIFLDVIRQWGDVSPDPGMRAVSFHLLGDGV